ncbi:MAG: tRNA (adenosine(37)-N6)-threonylcarbamoyltransferase complex ATPase subunit type 1 TsaE [Zoogloeaceae bacterium]|nr:tRNA (adenosine(37)-N6)-threonylcarbamoyltransferase complex ATPase subunit type 1 TsaE [Zoogloeaceae bacterium]
MFEIELPDLAASASLGKALAACLHSGQVIYLQGDLGAGKTTLVRGLLYALGHTGAVKSPTYALVEVYVVSRLYLYHFDFYRFMSPEEFLDAGLDEYFRKDSICLVEWPDKASGYVPPADLVLSLHEGEAGRRCALAANGVEGQKCLTEILAAWRAAVS